MGGWHECDERCQLLHAAVYPKVYRLLLASRTPDHSEGTGNVSERSFNLPIATSSPEEALVGEMAGGPLELSVVLESGGGLSEGTLLVESGSEGHFVPVKLEKALGNSSGPGIELERWKLYFERDEDVSGLVTLADFEKNMTIAFRALYALTQLLPAHSLVRRLREEEVDTRGIGGGVGSLYTSRRTKPCLRLVLQRAPLAAIPLEKSLSNEGAFESSSRVELVPVATPHGRLLITIKYRRWCNFTIRPVSSGSTTTTESSRFLSFENVELEANAPIKATSLPESAKIPLPVTALTTPPIRIAAERPVDVRSRFARPSSMSTSVTSTSFGTRHVAGPASLAPSPLASKHRTRSLQSIAEHHGSGLAIAHHPTAARRASSPSLRCQSLGDRSQRDSSLRADAKITALMRDVDELLKLPPPTFTIAQPDLEELYQEWAQESAWLQQFCQEHTAPGDSSRPAVPCSPVVESIVEDSEQKLQMGPRTAAAARQGRSRGPPHNSASEDSLRDPKDDSHSPTIFDLSRDL